MLDNVDYWVKDPKNVAIARARELADRVVAMRNGRVVEDAPTAHMDAHAIELIYGRNGGVAP